MFWLLSFLNSFSRMQVLHMVVCCYFILFVKAFRVRNDSRDSDIAQAFQTYMVVPQCIPNAPKNKLTLIFNNKEIEFGTKIHPFETVSASYLAYSANPNVLHTLTIFDPDQPFLYLPFGGQLLQGLIVNIPGMDVQHGDRLGVYVPHIPHPGSSYHRCVYLIFKQLEKIKITVDLRISLSTNLTQFNVYEFAKKFKLGDPIAGNFFISKLGTGEPRRVETPQITGH